MNASLNNRTAADAKQTHVWSAHKHNRPLIACRFHPNGEAIFFGAQDNQVWRWEVASDNKVSFAAHDSWVRAIAFCDAGDTLITGGYDGKLMWWPATSSEPKPTRDIQAHDGWLRAVAVSPDGQLLATVGNDLLVKLWSANDGKLLRKMSGHERHVYHVAFHPSGEHLVTGDLMGNLFHWEVATGKLLRKLKVSKLHKYDTGFKADIGGFRDLRFDPSGTVLACAGITNVTNAFAGVGNPLVVLCDWESGKEKIAYQSKGKLRGVAWGVAWHPDQFVIGLSGGGGGGYLLFWKGDQKEEFHQLKLPDTGRDLDLSPDGLHLATAHYDGNLRVSKMAPKEKEKPKK